MINEIHRQILKDKKKRFKEEPRIKKAVQGVRVRHEVYGDGYGDDLAYGFSLLSQEQE